MVARQKTPNALDRKVATTAIGVLAAAILYGTAGCVPAQQHLAPMDARHKREPSYKAGFNSHTPRGPNQVARASAFAEPTTCEEIPVVGKKKWLEMQAKVRAAPNKFPDAQQVLSMTPRQ